MTVEATLADLLATEHAAVYAYGALGARLDDATRRQAVAAYDAHRTRRDALVALLRARGQRIAGPAPSYDVAVADRTAALLLAVRVETELGVRWRDLVAATDEAALRRLAVQGLQDSAVRAAQWRRTAGMTSVTEALPGQA